jgi:hypothetical protein
MDIIHGPEDTTAEYAYAAAREPKLFELSSF